MNLLLRQGEESYLPAGRSRLITPFDGRKLDVFAYRPKTQESGVLFVFDGLRRNAEQLRDKAVVLAERTGLVTFAPLLDRERFPKWRYDTAGVVKRDRLQPRARWTGPLLQDLIEWAREVVGQPDTRAFLFGHSAGGQLLSRICAYSPLSNVQGIVITNPSAYVAPDLNEIAPFGFGGIFEPQEAVARLQVYLALPITIYLGRQDTGTRHLVRLKPARRQGMNRIERGRGVFNAASELAAKNAWAFNWHLVEVPGVGHSSRAMLKAEHCVQALGFHSPVDAGSHD